MNSQFTVLDMLRTSEAVLLFVPIVVTPGYVIAWLTNVLAFRDRTLMARLTIAVPFSIGMCPIISYYLWRVSFPAVWLFYGTCFAYFLLSLWRERPWRRFGIRGRVGYLAIVIGWAVLALLLLVDMQMGKRLYFPVVTYDYALRTAFTAAISRSGVPPHNPYFYPGQFFNLHYHYFWFILCSIVQKIAGGAVTSRQAMLAGTIWCGIGLLALIPLYLRFFQPGGRTNLTRRAMIGAGLLAVTGLDIVPTLLVQGASGRIAPSIEWWNDDQVTSWIAALTWVPHHVAALITCLMAFLLLWSAETVKSKQTRLMIAFSAALMSASAVGLSVYVALLFAIFLTIWLVIQFARKHRRAATLIISCGAMAVAVAIPYLLDLLTSRAGVGSGTTSAVTSPTLPLTFGVRHFLIADLALNVVGGGWRENIVNLLFVPLNYFLELGFFLSVCVIQLMRMWRDRLHLTEGQLCGAVMTLVSVVVCTFVRSTVIASNDFGWRGFMFAQFMLLIWGSELVSEGLLSARPSPLRLSSDKRFALIAMIIVGLAGTAYEGVAIRFYPVLSDTTSRPLYPWLSKDRKLGERTFALRSMYEELEKLTPQNAVFQHNPDAEPQDNFHSMYADRQLAAETPSCAVVFGGDAALCKDRIGVIQDLFHDTKAFDAAEIDQVCQRLSIDVLVAQNTDPVWQDHRSWIWNKTPILANDYARAFECGQSAMTGSK